MARCVASLNAIQASMPTIRKVPTRAVGAPSPMRRANTTSNTRKYAAMLSAGCTQAHSMPPAEPAKRAPISRRVSTASNDRPRPSSTTSRHRRAPPVLMCHPLKPGQETSY